MLVNDNPTTGMPGNFIALDAFNLAPGAAFQVLDEPDPRIWVVERQVLHGDFERVSIWAHALRATDLDTERAFYLDYCTKVALVGIVVTRDPDDDNWGQLS